MASMLGEADVTPAGRAPPAPIHRRRRCGTPTMNRRQQRLYGTMADDGTHQWRSGERPRRRQAMTSMRYATRTHEEGIIVRLPDANDQIRLAPVRALRAVFSGVGQLLLAADRLREEDA